MSSTAVERNECAICLDVCLNAVRLNCNHIFCWLCVKGSAQQSNNRCPVCRQPIDNNYFENPTLIESIDWKDVPQLEGEMQWQYEGRNGWLLYDTRTSRDIEKALDANESTFELLIAGFVYVIDFERMIQFRRNEPNRIRKIRRQPIDPNTTKGVAGLRTQFNDSPQRTTDSSLSNNSNETNCSQREDNSEEVVQQIESNDNEVQQQEVSIDGDRDVEQLQQLFNTNLIITDTQRETYL